MSVEIIGLEKTVKRLSSLQKLADLAMAKTVADLAGRGHHIAVDSIVNGGTRSGSVNIRRGHKRSAVGEVPKDDFGLLAGSIFSRHTGLSGEFGTSLDYGVKYEIGDGVGSRPFLLPASFLLKSEVKAILSKNVKKIMFGGI